MQSNYKGKYDAEMTYFPGDIAYWDKDHVAIACPGCGHVSAMHVGDPKPEKSPSWLMTGPLERLTLAPSINCIGCCGWHGYLVEGVFRHV